MAYVVRLVLIDHIERRMHLKYRFIERSQVKKCGAIKNAHGWYL